MEPDALLELLPGRVVSAHPWEREPEPPACTLRLSSPDGELVAHGVDLDDWEHARDMLARRAAARGWVGPYRVAPAPGNPAGVDLPGLPMAPTTWQHVGARWAGRDVLVRWEEEPASSPTVRPFHGGGRAIVLRGRITRHLGDSYTLTTDGEAVRPPSFAHVVDMPTRGALGLSTSDDVSLERGR